VEGRFYLATEENEFSDFREEDEQDSVEIFEEKHIYNDKNQKMASKIYHTESFHKKSDFEIENNTPRSNKIKDDFEDNDELKISLKYLEFLERQVRIIARNKLLFF
jgi:hypothetical protein